MFLDHLFFEPYLHASISERVFLYSFVNSVVVECSFYYWEMVRFVVVGPFSFVLDQCCMQAVLTPVSFSKTASPLVVGNLMLFCTQDTF